MTVDTAYTDEVVSVGPHHHHRWTAGPTDTRWSCRCGAWISMLATRDGQIIKLPKDRRPA